ncbi:MAG: hypothetical protein K8R50_12260, partial [Betaproteobacteria bacterium]|nr:hypothetical protein [Betaproteobacteria bacterium]
YGYNIEADTPLGSPAKELCVAMAYKDVHLNNPNNPEIPSWGKNIKSVDGFDIQKAYKNGGRLVFAAQSYHLNTDDSERSGKYVVVSLAERDAAVIAIDATGRGDGLLNMDDAGITKSMADMINKGERAM